jgi:sugar O-acyltransferase (sialic acid O-acetyltransferase NeuD family)
VRSIVLIGGGEHCASCIEAIESTGQWDIAGIVDLPERRGESILGYPIIGSDVDLPALAARFAAATVTVGQIKSADVRRRLFSAAIAAGFGLPVIAASTARVSRHAVVGAGTIVMHQAVVNSRAEVGVNCIINTGAIVEHDAVVESNCHVSTGSIINGACHVGEGCFVGSGAVLRNGVRLGDRVVLGAGTVAVSDLRESGTYAGCPARKIG